MSKRRQHLNSAHEADEDLVPQARESTRKRPRYYSPSTARRNDIKERKLELMRQYQEQSQMQKEMDKAWSWLSSLNIPCHNTAIPIQLHTNAKNAADSEESPELKPVAELEVYDAHSITPEVLSMYCDWKILSGVKAHKTDAGEESADMTVLRCYRSEEKRFQHNDPSKHPSYTTSPLCRLSADGKIKGVDRHVLETLCSIKSTFKNAVLRIPQDWKDIPDDDYRSLPAEYQKLLAKAEEHRGRLPEKGEEEFFDRASSQPLEGLPGTPPTLEQQARLSLSPRGKDQLDSLREKFPIGDEVTREVALKNAKAAQEVVYQSVLPNQFATARRDVAVKLRGVRYEQAVEWISRKGVMEADQRYGLGSVLVQDTSSKPAHQTASLILNWIHKRAVEEGDSEGCTEKDVGGLLKDIIVGENVEPRNQSSLLLPSCLQMAAVNPKPDVFSLPKASSFPSLKRFLTVIFAGECKKNGKDHPKTPAQLACALNGTLVLLVLMYLDMRRDLQDPLPPWMFVYGILYTEKGLIIRAHFPAYQFNTDTDGGNLGSDEEFLELSSEVASSKAAGKKGKPKGDAVNGEKGKPKWAAINGDHARWIFKSVEVTKVFSGAFKDKGEIQRLQLLASLLMIQSHSFFLLKQLDAWAKGASAESAYAAFSDVCGD